MRKIFLTKSAKETRKFGEQLAKKLRGGSAGWRIIALEGELGSGKTTFAQGLLRGLKIKGPYTSPTFVVIKQYKKQLTCDKKHLTRHKKISSNVKCQVSNVYHVDAYRVTARDILTLGWKEIINNKDNIIVIEWADRIRKIIPRRAQWIKFRWLGKDQREIKLFKKKSN